MIGEPRSSTALRPRHLYSHLCSHLTPWPGVPSPLSWPPLRRSIFSPISSPTPSQTQTPHAFKVAFNMAFHDTLSATVRVLIRLTHIYSIQELAQLSLKVNL